MIPIAQAHLRCCSKVKDLSQRFEIAMIRQQVIQGSVGLKECSHTITSKLMNKHICEHYKTCG